MSDPLGLPIAEFEAMLGFVIRGDLVRDPDADPCRAFVESALERGDL